MTQVRVLKAHEAQPAPGGGCRDRFMLDGADTDERFALVQHLFAPRALAAPMHRHHHEDEWSYVLEGRIGAVIEGREVEVGPGDLLFKPRGQWHTFWNAGDEPATVLELISPAGLEQVFRAMAEDASPEVIEVLAARHGCDVDMEATGPVLERHRLTF